MSTVETILTIGAVVAGTMLTRFLPFIIFSKIKPPKFVSYLGRVLPAAVIGLLIVYCLKDAVFTPAHGLPEGIAILFIALLHIWRKNIFLSLGLGTIFYMVLVQYIFI